MLAYVSLRAEPHLRLQPRWVPIIIATVSDHTTINNVIPGCTKIIRIPTNGFILLHTTPLNHFLHSNISKEKKTWLYSNARHRSSISNVGVWLQALCLFPDLLDEKRKMSPMHHLKTRKSSDPCIGIMNGYHRITDKL